MENKALEEKFRQKRQQFFDAGKATSDILLFHGTSSENADNICRLDLEEDNLTLKS